MESPSFNTHSCINIADIANRVVQELQIDKGFSDLISFNDDEINEDEENTQEDEFEFPLIFPDSSLTDNIIYNDQISPRYPLFDRSLLLNLDSNLSNTNDSKSDLAPALAPTLAPVSALAPATTTVSTVTPTPVTASAPTPTSTPVTASAPTLVTASTVTPPTNPDPVAPPSTRLSLSKLFSEDRDSTQSATLLLELNNLEKVSPETYCIWKPQEQEHQPPKHHSRGKHKKSNSISISDDTSSKRWKVRDLLKRSYSDDSKHTSCVSIYSPPSKPKNGKDGSVVVFLPPISPKPNNEKVKKPEKSLKTNASMGGGCTNHKLENKTPAYKAKIGNIRLPAFLPYREDQHQVDAFANHYKWVK